MRFCKRASFNDNRLPRMAPNLAESQHAEIRDMIHSKSLNAVQMAKVAGCSDRSVRAIRSNLRYFGSTKAPSNGVGRPRSVTPPMLDALCEHLLEKPNLYQDEMAIFLWDEFEVACDNFQHRKSAGFHRLDQKSISAGSKGAEC